MAPIALPRLLSLHVGQMTASLMVGKAEALRLHLVQQCEIDVNEEPPPPPELPAVGLAHGGGSGRLPDVTDGAGAGGGASSVVGDSALEPSIEAYGISSRPGGGFRDGADARAAIPLSAGRGGSSSRPSLPAGWPMQQPIGGGGGRNLGPSEPTGRSVRLLEVFENQRRMTTFHPYRPGDLLPLDPGSWSDEAYTCRFVEIDLVPLPPSGDGFAWRWLEDWMVDSSSAGRASDGWQYALNWNTGWLSASNAITLVRRRRWTRRAERIPTERSAKRSEAVVGASCQRGGGGGTATIASSGDHGNGGGNGGNGDAGGGNPTRRNDGLLVGWRGRDESIEGSRDGGVGREGAVVGGGRLDSTPGSPVATSTPNPSLASPPHVQRLLAERSEALDESLGTLGLARGAVGAASSPDRGKLQQPPEQRRQRRSSKEAASLNPASQERSSNGGSCSSAGGSPPTSPPRDATGRTPRLSVDPNGVPWPPLAGGGAALLQLSTAPGAHLRVRGQEIELDASPALLFDHLAEILQEQLARHPWYAEPLRILCERLKVHLASAHLHVSSAVRIIALVEGGECHVTIEGVPEEAIPGMKQGAPDQSPREGGKNAAADVCATFTNEVNLLDLVDDVQAIYRSFTANLSGVELRPD